ncbi:hypothetical protein LZ554_002342 [Drepanopeziza brunnea f. sp. 'monogermtubi']|nr:hypothetical protein LZ554_002342 [Drepanopeziza brunnea f. sp. 'monogermtubi']
MVTTFTTQSATSTATNTSTFDSSTINSSTIDSKSSSSMSDFSSYYCGLPGRPRLLARSSKIPWAATIVTDRGFSRSHATAEAQRVVDAIKAESAINRAEKRVPVPSWVADMKRKRDTCERFLTSDVRELGIVHSSSGIRVSRARAGRRHRVDCALINVDQNNRCLDQSFLVNQLPPCENLLHTSNPSYVKTAGKTSYDSRPKDVDDVPEYLGNHLTWHDILEKQDMADDVYKDYIVWKHGRPSHFTWGITGAIASDYLWGDGVTKSDEWHIKDAPRGSGFSLKGDSGALVWDIDGAVVGMMWGGCFQRLVTYVTPIEAVLADIKETLGARDVRMVVRNPTRN